MIVILFAIVVVSVAVGLVYLADVWEKRERARRRHEALRSFYERES
jgi:hypothetical protein